MGIDAESRAELESLVLFACGCGGARGVEEIECLCGLICSQEESGLFEGIFTWLRCWWGIGGESEVAGASADEFAAGCGECTWLLDGSESVDGFEDFSGLEVSDLNASVCCGDEELVTAANSGADGDL